MGSELEAPACARQAIQRDGARLADHAPARSLFFADLCLVVVGP